MLFDKYNKTDEEKPADPSPYPDPYMIFDKYSNPGKPQEINIQYDPKEVFSKYGEQDKKPEKRYDPKEIFDKYNGKALRQPRVRQRGRDFRYRRCFVAYRKVFRVQSVRRRVLPWEAHLPAAFSQIVFAPRRTFQ